MARPLPTQAQEAVLDVIARFPDGASTEQIAATLDAPPNRRTLQRWLDAIVQQSPIECDTRSKPYGYRWMNTAQGLNLPLLTATEALLVQLARVRSKSCAKPMRS